MDIYGQRKIKSVHKLKGKKAYKINVFYTLWTLWTLWTYYLYCLPFTTYTNPLYIYVL